MKRQVIVINGGDTFNTYDEYISFLTNYKIDFERYKSGKRDWKKTLGDRLGKEFEVILPEMPNRSNVKYNEWKIWFEKFILYFEQKIILVGHSLGGIFLVKYLSENDFPKEIKGAFLVAAPFQEGDFILSGNLRKFETQTGKIFIYHSQDDPIVPFVDSKKYINVFKNAIYRVVTNRGHFNQEEFPELVKDISSLR